MKLRLNAFLLREGVTPVDALTDAARAKADTYRLIAGQLVPMGAAEPFEPGEEQVAVTLYEHPTQPPPWQRFVAAALPLTSFAGASRSSAAIIFCSAPDDDEHGSEIRWIAWCFGAGFRLIRKTKTDPRFGLLIALNTASPAGAGSPRLRNLEYRVQAPYFQQAGHRAAADIPVEGFRVDVDSDLVSAAGAHTSDPVFGDVSGGRSVQFKQDVDDVEDLKALSATALRKWRAISYKDAFRWVDNIIPVADEALVVELREKVLGFLQASPIPNHVDVLIPDDLVGLRDERIAEYVAFPRERGAKEGRRTLTVEMVAGLVKSLEGKHPGSALDSELRFFDASKEFLGSVTVLECLTAELHVGQEVYVVNDGDFYVVDPTFVERVDAAMNDVHLSDISLPCYGGGTEPQYIEKLRHGHGSDFAVVDRALLYVDGETPVEACDVVSRSGALIHLKRKGRSSVFSHLCFQASSSCVLLKASQAAQDQLLTLATSSGARGDLIRDVSSNLDPIRVGGGVEVVFGLLGKWGTRTLRDLPLVSKVSLSQSVRRITQLGFRPTALLIDRC